MIFIETTFRFLDISLTMSAGMMRKASFQLISKFDTKAAPLLSDAIFRVSQHTYMHDDAEKKSSLGIAFKQKASNFDQARVLHYR